jgi:segregation and condensation protein B
MSMRNNFRYAWGRDIRQKGCSGSQFMQEQLSGPEIKGRLEALLFVAETVSTEALARGLDLPEPQVEELLRDLAHDLEVPKRGVHLRKVAGRWRLETKPEHAPAIAACDALLVARPLTAQALDTLAIVALRQPVSSSEVNAIRGVNSQGTLETLQGRGLIAQAGQSSARRKAIYWRTTTEFLDQFGLESLDEMNTADSLERVFGPTYGKLGGAGKEATGIAEPTPSQAIDAKASSQ